MKNHFITLIIISVSVLLFQDLFAQSDLSWNGYIQTRLNSDFSTHNEFMIRRGKLWMKGNVPNVDNLSFKLQVVFRSSKDKFFVVQDVYAKYENEGHKFLLGRMVPDFTLEWNQSDAVLPTLERGLISDGIIHGDQSVARMIGFQYRYDSQNHFHIGAGLFNANFNLPGKNSDKSFLYTLRSGYDFIHSATALFHLGFSASYRKLNNLSLPRIYDAAKTISGDDYRWGFESALRFKGLELQGEYLTANINKERAWGYYVYSTISINEKTQPVVMVEKYADLNNTTNDSEWYGVGLNYSITKQTKIMSDFRTQFSNSKNNYLGRIQFQIFFN
jgi:phosphate-selective porin